MFSSQYTTKRVTVVTIYDPQRDYVQKDRDLADRFAEFLAEVECMPHLIEASSAQVMYMCDVIRENPSDVANSKLSLWSRFRAVSELFPQLFELYLYDIHIQSYD